MSGLPRETLRWLQSLRLSSPVRHVRRDFCNGFLVAEVFARYFPQDIDPAAYYDASALDKRLSNWAQLNKFFQDKDIQIPRDMIDGTVHCKPGAAEPLVELIYTTLTNREARPEGFQRSSSYNDAEYQATLPPYARATTAAAIRSNVRSSELVTVVDEGVKARKMGEIVASQRNASQEDRQMDPGRYGIRPVTQTGHRVKPRSSPRRRTGRRTSPDTLTSSQTVRFGQLGDTVKRVQPKPPTRRMARTADPVPELGKFVEVTVQQTRVHTS